MIKQHVPLQAISEGFPIGKTSEIRKIEKIHHKTATIITKNYLRIMINNLYHYKQDLKDFR